MGITFNSISLASNGTNPNRDAMLKAYSAFKDDLAALEADLNAVPPNISDARKRLEDMLSQAQALNLDANGDMAAVPAIQEMIGVVQNLQALLNGCPPDVQGCLELLRNGGVIGGDLSAIFQVITSGPPVPPSGPPDIFGIMYQEFLLTSYLDEFKQDLEDGNYNDADRIYGYVLTAMQNLFKDANYDPVFASQFAKLYGSIDDLRTLFLSGDYQGCLNLLRQIGF